MKSFLPLLVLLICTGLSCKKEAVTIKGYTSTDAMGNILSQEDRTDWIFYPTWSNKETNVFFGVDAGDLTGASAGTISIYPAFPNPCSVQFHLSFQSTTVCKGRFVLVNKNLERIFSATMSVAAGGNHFVFSPEPAKFKAGSLYRLYYTFDAENHSMFLKGHGDIMVQ